MGDRINEKDRGFYRETGGVMVEDEGQNRHQEDRRGAEGDAASEPASGDGPGWGVRGCTEGECCDTVAHKARPTGECEDGKGEDKGEEEAVEGEVERRDHGGRAVERPEGRGEEERGGGPTRGKEGKRRGKWEILTLRIHKLLRMIRRLRKYEKSQRPESEEETTSHEGSSAPIVPVEG